MQEGVQLLQLQTSRVFHLMLKNSPDAEKLRSWLNDGVEGVREVSRKGQHVVHAEAHLFHQVVHLVRIRIEWLVHDTKY